MTKSRDMTFSRALNFMKDGFTVYLPQRGSCAVSLEGVTGKKMAMALSVATLMVALGVVNNNAHNHILDTFSPNVATQTYDASVHVPHGVPADGRKLDIPPYSELLNKMTHPQSSSVVEHQNAVQDMARVMEDVPAYQSTPVTPPPMGMIVAVNHASKATGISPEFLLALADQESGFDHKAKAHHTSAMGAFQFVKDTWHEAIMRYGKLHGLGHFSNAIHKNADGDIVVKRGQEKAINALRANNAIAALMTAHRLIESKAKLENILHRPATSTDLYIAHLMGDTGAIRFLQAIHDTPNMKSDLVVKTVVQNNQPLFLDGNRIMSVQESYHHIQDIISDNEKQFHAYIQAAKEEAKKEKKNTIKHHVIAGHHQVTKHHHGNASNHHVIATAEKTSASHHKKTEQEHTHHPSPMK